MFNSERPSLEELPSSAQLWKSTIIAIIAAVLILVTIVLPAEYGIDPTGIGKKIGLAEMGEIKTQLAEEADMDHHSMNFRHFQPNLLDGVLGLFVSSAQAEEVKNWQDSVNFNLSPTKSTEWKLVMTKGQRVEFEMHIEGGKINFELHGHGNGKSVTYEKGRGLTGLLKGTLIAEFDGEHGWFWRNRDKKDVGVTVFVRGDYIAVKGFD